MTLAVSKIVPVTVPNDSHNAYRSMVHICGCEQPAVDVEDARRKSAAYLRQVARECWALANQVSGKCDGNSLDDLDAMLDERLGDLRPHWMREEGVAG